MAESQKLYHHYSWNLNSVLMKQKLWQILKRRNRHWKKWLPERKDLSENVRMIWKRSQNIKRSGSPKEKTCRKT